VTQDAGVFEVAPREPVARVVARLAQFLEGRRIEEASLDARHLVLAATGLSRADLVLRPEAPFGAEAAARLEAFAARRGAREPVTRILGARGFWTLDLAVMPNVLDPRADTETLVAFALELLAPRREEPLRILDLGSGSGAILCALLSELPNALGVAVDLSPAACAATVENLKRCGVSQRAATLRGRWATAIDGPFDLVVANPPYIESAAIDGLDPEVRLHDPRLALDGGSDGFHDYRTITGELSRLLTEGGVAVFEAGAGQAEEIAKLMQNTGLRALGTRSDAGGHARAVAALRQKP
jgi:release factor glutamine methyltransferase